MIIASEVFRIIKNGKRREWFRKVCRRTYTFSVGYSRKADSDKTLRNIEKKVWENKNRRIRRVNYRLDEFQSK